MISVIPKDRDSGPIEVVRGVDYTFVIDIYDEDMPVALTGDVANIDIRNGSTYHVDDGSMTAAAGEDGSTKNRLSYTWSSSAHPSTPRADVLVEVTTTTTAGEPVYWRARLDLVRWGLRPMVTEDDLFSRWPALRASRLLGIEDGTADSGDTTSLIDAKLAAYPDDFYNGGILEILDGTNEGTERPVTDFAQSTGDITVSPAFGSAIDSTSRYRVRRSWRPLISEAFAELKRRVRNEGNRPHLIVDAIEMRIPHMYLAAAMCFQANTKGGVDSDDWEIGEDLRNKADNWFVTSRFTYDIGDDGNPDGEIRGRTSIQRRA